MYSRISSGAILLALTGCGGPPEQVAPGNVKDAGGGTPAEAPAEHVTCAVGDADYADVCTIERTATADGALLTIRRPDGGFRRLRLTADGGVAAADGAMPVRILARTDTTIDVAIGDMRYRLPR